MKRNFRLVIEFLMRELRVRFAGSISGGLWAVFLPLIQLGVYAFAFVHIFKQIVPGVNPPGYLAFLVTAMWPWFAFSEGIVRSATVIQENTALIGKVAIPRVVLVVANVAATFLVHMAGFSFILIVLASTGTEVNAWKLPVAFALFIPLFALCLGLSLIIAACQVFVRDLAQAIGQITTLLMFAAPILYARSALPERFQAMIDMHPFTFYAETFRSLLLDYGTFEGMRLTVACAAAVAMLVLGSWIFRRLDPHFEDFL